MLIAAPFFDQIEKRQKDIKNKNGYQYW